VSSHDEAKPRPSAGASLIFDHGSGLVVPLPIEPASLASPLKRIAPLKQDLRMLRLRGATPLDDYKVRLTLTNGDVVERDLDALIWGPVFEPLRRDRSRFQAVTVEAGTLTWPGDLDFDPDALIWGGPAP